MCFDDVAANVKWADSLAATQMHGWGEGVYLAVKSLLCTVCTSLYDISALSWPACCKMT